MEETEPVRVHDTIMVVLVAAEQVVVAVEQKIDHWMSCWISCYSPTSSSYSNNQQMGFQNQAMMYLGSSVSHKDFLEP